MSEKTDELEGGMAVIVDAITNKYPDHKFFIVLVDENANVGVAGKGPPEVMARLVHAIVCKMNQEMNDEAAIAALKRHAEGEVTH